MKIPGFNAEASIYKSPEHYTSQTTSSGSSQTLVQPAVDYGCIIGCMTMCMNPPGGPGCLESCKRMFCSPREGGTPR